MLTTRSPPVGEDISLSARSGTLAPGEEVGISLSLRCGQPGDTVGSIRVRSSSGKQSAIVNVPVELHCYTTGDARFVSIEMFQGPPIYKKDFVAGTETDPVAMLRPENGAKPKDDWIPYYDDEASGERVYPYRDNAWSVKDNGFVTAIWGRRAAVAVTLSHRDAMARVHLDVQVDDSGATSTVLSPVHEETHPAGDHYETAFVFEMSRDLYVRGASVSITISSNQGRTSARIPFFGETVETFMLTWIPISID